MGSDKSDVMAYGDEQPVHPVELPLFYISRHLVTNAQFRPFVEGDGYNNKDYWTAAGWAWRNGAEADLSPIQDHSDEGWKRRYAEWLARRPKERRSQPWYWDDPQRNGANRPVVGVSWYEALAWCRWLDARLRVAGGVLRTVEGQEVAIPPGFCVHLPSEAEWEKAARGGDGRIWPWPGAWQEGRANSKEAGLEQTSPVGLFPDGRSAHGLLDMAAMSGNGPAASGAGALVDLTMAIPTIPKMAAKIWTAPTCA
jgi:formylglycine-generating enzyme required for sulfatase activity